MEQKHKALIYPYCREFSPIVRHCSLLAQYQITSLVSPKGFAYAGKDACIADKGPAMGVPVYDSFEDRLAYCDTVIITDFCPSDTFKKSLLDKIDLAIGKRKDIVCILPLDPDELDSYREKCARVNVDFLYYGTSDKRNTMRVGDQLHEIGVPVVFVAGTFDNTGKFEIQLSLRENLMSEGYKVSQIGTRSYCELMGFHSFPGFMYDPGVSEVQKVALFNKFVKDMEIKEDPDIIIIGIPGAILPYNKDFREKFGITAFLVSQAIQPDFVLLSVLYYEYLPDYFPRMYGIIRNRFGFEVDVVGLSNARFDTLCSMEFGKKFFDFLEMEHVDFMKNSIESGGVPILNVLNAADSKKMAGMISETLSSSSYLVSMSNA